MTTTRRQFIGQTSGAIAVAALPCSLRAAQARGRLTLGYSLYGMKMLPLAEALKECARIGYRSVELCLFPGYPAEPKALSVAARKEIRAQLQALGVSVSTLMLNVRLAGDDSSHAQNLAGVRAAVELAHDLVPDQPPPIQAQFGDGKPAQWEELKARSAARLREWGGVLADTGGTALIGAHAGAMLNSPERLLWLYHQVERPEFALYYNHIHYTLEGFSLAQSWQVLGRYTRFIHLQDATGDGQNKNYLLPGDGPTDFPAYFRLLSDSGYSGTAAVHISGKFSNVPGYQPIPVAEKCHTVMIKALRESGARLG